MTLAHAVAANTPLRWSDVVAPPRSVAVDVRREMERMFASS
jgi:hypothetical protein